MNADDDATGNVGGELLVWLNDNWDPELTLREWRRRLVEAGWACPSWPRKWGGRALSASDAELVVTTLEKYGVPGAPASVGMHLAVPTLLEHGGDELNRRLLEPTATGELVWCQLFSEPGAGSDLAGLTTRAERDGDEWVVSGQKVWNTGAAHAHLGLLLARTDFEAPKHRGITYFVLDMSQDGIDVRPVCQMNGHSSFNEVFLDEVRVPTGNVVGETGQGWRAALTTLAHERRLTSLRPTGSVRDGDGRVWAECRAEQRAASEPHKWYPQRAGRGDLLIERARDTSRGNDPVVRQAIADVQSMSLAARWTSQRAAAARALGRAPGPEGSIGKLMTSNIARSASRAHSLIAGASGMLAGPTAPAGGLITEVFTSVPGQSIAGGTDEIQHNIIAERILGLPKEPANDAERPFRDVAKNV